MLIYGKKAHFNGTHLLVSRSSASATVKYEGHKKNGCFGGNSVSQTQIVFLEKQ